MYKRFGLISLLFLLFFSTSVIAAEKALVLEVKGAIGPATQDYIHRGIHAAENQHASLIILELDTPGGLETAMRGINQAIISSPIPVLTYVAPSGARAASAGTFILYASHIAAMAPGTNIGAAAPVNLTSKADAKEATTEEKKATNDAAAYIRSLAALRGRNSAWGEQAVTAAASLSAEEAKKLNVIDEIADNYPDLLKKIDGRTIVLQGHPKKIQTQGLQLENSPPDWRYQFLSFLTNPNFAYILMLIAIYGLFFELANPGLILPGVAGVISLLLVLYAFQLMPINYVGLTLLLIGIVFMVFEVYVASFGVIGIGGVIAFIIGSIMLFNTQDPHFHLALSLIISMSLITLAFFFMLVTLAFRSYKKKIVTGKEGLIGSDGVVLDIMDERIVVRVLGEIWDAHATQPVARGQQVQVIGVHGLTLEVKPVGAKIPPLTPDSF